MPGPSPAGREPRPRACWAEVDLSALKANLRLVRSLAPGAPVLAVVKADAYGHGAVPVSRALVEEGVEGLGVATVAEGRELRVAGLSAPVLVLGRSLPEEYPEALRWGLEVAVPDIAHARELSRAGVAAGSRGRAHLKLDTGMSRLGVPWEQGAAAALEVASLPALALAGVFTHLASADFEDRSFAEEQAGRLARVRREMEGLGVSAPFHLGNSAAALAGILPPGTGIRPGIVLYGVSPFPRRSPPGLRPVMSWKCRVIQVHDLPAGTGVSYGHSFTTRRPTRLATVGVGYADGFPRNLSNRARLLVRGRRAPVAGRVCMDLTMLDVTDIPGVEAGDEVVIIGCQGSPEGGEERITAQELADLAETISYEILCRVGPRVPRIAFEEEP